MFQFVGESDIFLEVRAKHVNFCLKRQQRAARDYKLGFVRTAGSSHSQEVLLLEPDFLLMAVGIHPQLACAQKSRKL